MPAIAWRVPEEERHRTLLSLTGQLSGAARPTAVSGPGRRGKFAPDGTVLPWPGNTFLCHVDPSSAFHAALCAVQEGLATSHVADHFALLPPASFHMTVFGGIGGDPPCAEGWPEGVPAGLSRDEVSRLFARRLEALAGPPSFALRPRSLSPNSVRLCGADAGAERALRDMRDRLRDVTGLNRPGHDAYGFHVSLGYQLRWLDDDAADALMIRAEALFADRMAGFDRVELGPLAFCDFDTMHAFRTLGRLGPDGYRAGAGPDTD